MFWDELDSHSGIILIVRDGVDHIDQSNDSILYRELPQRL